MEARDFRVDPFCGGTLPLPINPFRPNKPLGNTRSAGKFLVVLKPKYGTGTAVRTYRVV